MIAIIFGQSHKGILEQKESSMSIAYSERITVHCRQCQGSNSILLDVFNSSLKKRRTDNRLILLYKGLKGKARIPTDDHIPKARRCRNSHSKAFQLPSASVKAYKCSFFLQTIRDWNDLPDTL